VWRGVVWSSIRHATSPGFLPDAVRMLLAWSQFSLVCIDCRIFGNLRTLADDRRTRYAPYQRSSNVPHDHRH
jgi:hypothetical protein